MEAINAGANRLKKVVLIGPESTGKSTLAGLLANHYHTNYVSEYAREYIDKLGRPYEEKDLLHIAEGQLKHEDEAAKNANNILICDTNLLVLKVWGEHKFGACYQQILDAIHKRKYDLYLLTNIDVPWEDDPQREHPDMRNFFYDIYKQEVENSGVPWVEVTGEELNQRKRMAIEAIDEVLAKAKPI